MDIAHLSTGKLLTTKEAASILGLSTTTLRRWRSEKQGPEFIRLGLRHCRYPLAGIEKYLQAGRNSSNQ